MFFLDTNTLIYFFKGMGNAASRMFSESPQNIGIPSIGPYDTLIAGTALTHSAILVTHNTKEFKRIKGLLIQDWF